MKFWRKGMQSFSSSFSLNMCVLSVESSIALKEHSHINSNYTHQWALVN